MTGCVIDTSEKLEVSCAYISSRLLLGQSHRSPQHLWDTVTETRAAIFRVLEWPCSGFCARNSLPSEHKRKVMAPRELAVIQTMVFLLTAVCNSVLKSKWPPNIDCFPAQLNVPFTATPHCTNWWAVREFWRRKYNSVLLHTLRGREAFR